MSRIGNMSIEVPKGAKVSFSGDLFTVEGPKGKLTQSYDSCISFNQEGSLIRVVRSSEEKSVKAKHGLYRNLLNNMLIGVVQGFSRVLVINGVGYRGEVKGNILTLNLGYSNQIEYMIPQGVQIAVENNTKISVAGISKEQVGQVASEIRSLRAPEPYKGKGIRYEDETIRRKVGKSGVKK